MYLHRIIDNHATATSPGLLTHREHHIPTFFTNLSEAIGKEVAEALWLRQYDVAHALIDFHQRANDDPLNDTIENPLIVNRDGQTIIFRIDYNSLDGKDRNVWGTVKSDIMSTEYCVECEQRVGMGHFDNCPTRTVGIPTPGTEQ